MDSTFSKLIDEVYVANGLAGGKVLTLENQSYLEQLLFIKIELLTQLGKDNEFVDFVQKTTKQFIDTNMDLVFVFAKTYQKNIKQIGDKDALRRLAEFTLNEVVASVVEAE